MVDRRMFPERYVARTRPEELSREFLLTMVGYLDRLLDGLASGEMQDIADHLDYGPQELSPRAKDKLLTIERAFHRACREQDERCKRGEHHLDRARGDLKCRHCGSSVLTVIHGGGESP